MSKLLIVAVILAIAGIVIQARTSTRPSRFSNQNSLPSLLDMILDATKLNSPLSIPAVVSLGSAAICVVLFFVFTIVSNLFALIS